MITKYKQELIENIINYIVAVIEQKEIIRELYNKTELFEKKNENDYRHDLFNFFAKKITRNSKEINELYSLLEDDEIKEINKIIIIERK